jgi:hypothetical protein
MRAQPDRRTQLAKAIAGLPKVADRSRYNKLIALLPSKDSPYSFDDLSKAETTALEAALQDGFRSFDDGHDHEAQPLPKEIGSGLLSHFFFVRSSCEYDYERHPDEFWNGKNSSGALPFVRFPVGFNVKRLRLYFANQLDRFCARLINDEPEYAWHERWVQES